MSSAIKNLGGSDLPSSVKSVSETDSMVGDKYIVVRRSDFERKVQGEDRKADANNAASDAPSSVDLSRPALSKAGVPRNVGTSSVLAAHARRGLKPSKDGLIRVRLWQKIAQSQATTALVTASALQPASGSGFTEFSALYDTCRCLGVDLYTFASEGTVSDIASWAVAFDPGYTGNLSAVIGALEHKYHTGPVKVAQGYTAFGACTPTGYHHLRGNTVKQFVSSTTNDMVGSNWYPTSISSSIIGYLKPYVENAAAGTVYFTAFVAYDMEFKYRG